MWVTCCELCRPISDRLRLNYDGYWQRYRCWFAALITAAAADFLSTLHFMVTDGIQSEIHPLVRYSALLMGPIVGVLLAKLFQLTATFVVTLYCRVLARYVFFAATVFYLWAAWFNIWGHRLYRPWAMQFLPAWW